jgi:1-phosphofructokinase family hexose kinase
MRILTVTVNPSVDKSIRVQRIERGKEHRSEDLILRAGGKGINVSRTLRKLGMDSIVTGFVGGAAGSCFKKMLSLEKLSFDFVEVCGETRTNLSMIETSTGQTTRILESGPRIRLTERSAFKRLCARHLEKVDHLVIAGKQIPGGEGLYNELICMAHKRGVRTILDTSGPSLEEGLQARPYMIKPNRLEAEEFFQQSLSSKQAWKKAVQRFLERGIAVVVISLGERGAVGSDGEEVWWGKVPILGKGPTVGCGDAFIAGFLYANRYQYSFAQALCCGIAAGSANAGNQTPHGHFSKSEMIKYAKCVKLERL